MCGQGADELYGGAGSDVFKYTSVGDSDVGAGFRDVIKDFEAREWYRN